MLGRLTLVIFFLCFSTLAVGQTNDVWLTNIKRNALPEQSAQAVFRAAPAGFALYFSRAGEINVPYLVRVPKGYDPARPTPVVLFLHGAILAKDSFQYKDPEISNEPVFSIADSLNALVVFPFARADFKWSGVSPAYENIINIIQQVERDYNVDKRKIFIGGISMGGIATFWFINNKPDIFAGFYTFSAVPRANGGVNFGNLSNGKPLYSLNAKDDPIFPYTEMQQAFEQHKNEAPGWHFSTVETGGHRFIYGAGGAHYVQTVIRQLVRPLQLKL